MSKVLLLVLFATSSLFVSSVTSNFAYRFADGVESLLSAPLNKEFSCEGRIYGYYADTNNDCQVFHVCIPAQNEDGDVTSMGHFSFMCPNQTIFNQESLTCASSSDSIACAESTQFYDIVNAEFGRIPDQN